VRGRAGRRYGLSPTLPQAERQTLTLLVGLALEVAQEAASLEGLLVGAVVVLAQEVEVRARPTDGAEDDQVEPLESAAGKRGIPAKAILDGPRCIVWIYGADLLAGSSPVFTTSISSLACGTIPLTVHLLPCHQYYEYGDRNEGPVHHSNVPFLLAQKDYLCCLVGVLGEAYFGESTFQALG
jgi:hypothetical protein